MTLRLLLLVSAGLNLWFLLKLSDGSPRLPVGSAALPAPAAWALPESSLVPPDPDRSAAIQALHQGDFSNAVATLRRLGFPQGWIEDLVIGAANRRFGPTLLALRQPAEFYWRPVERRQPQENAGDLEQERQARVLEAERNKLLEHTLGVEWSSVQASTTGRPDPLDLLTRAFAPTARPEARRILAEFDAIERDVIRSAGGTIGMPERTELNRLYRDKIERLKSVLSPAEIEEYELRTSWTAEHLRQIDLVGFEPTEAEFRTIFRIRKSFDELSLESLSGLPAEEENGPRWRGENDLEDAIRQALGEQRYADYRRSQDYTFRGLVELAGEFDLSNQTAVLVHDLRESFLTRRRELQSISSAPAPERIAAIQKLQTGAQSDARRLLGEAAYARYTQLQIGGWLFELDQP